MSTANPGPTPTDSPFDRTTALAELRALGRQLNRQAADRTDASTAELDATLEAMRALHARIMADLADLASPATPPPAGGRTSARAPEPPRSV